MTDQQKELEMGDATEQCLGGDDTTVPMTSVSQTYGEADDAQGGNEETTQDTDNESTNV